MAALASSPFTPSPLRFWQGLPPYITQASHQGLGAAAPVVHVHPGTAEDITISDLDTVNATQPGSVSSTVSASSATPTETADATAGHFKVLDDDSTGTAQLPLYLVNNFPGGAVNAYVTGLDVNGNLVMLQSDGSYYYPTCDSSSDTPESIDADISIPLSSQGSTTSITLPDYISSARVYFANGDLQFFTVCSSDGSPSLVEPSSVNPSDPSAGINWGFVELTNTDDGLYANISYVDFVGLVLGMSLTDQSGDVQTALGLEADAVSSICAALVNQSASDGQPWDDLCMYDDDGNALRIVAPSDYTATYSDAFSEYFDEYIEQIWTHYGSNVLIIDTQSDAGSVNCTVSYGTLTCDGDNRGYAQPTAADIFGCNTGPFAIESTDNDIHSAVVPRLCAAFNRSTYLLYGGHIQPSLPSESYYLHHPTNWYSSLIHDYEVDGKGYAFSYDDVNPSGENESGVVSSATPQSLTIIVGGPLSS